MKDLINKMNGYKSYIGGGASILTGITLIIGALVNGANGDLTGSNDIAQGLQMIITGFSVMALKHAIVKEK